MASRTRRLQPQLQIALLQRRNRHSMVARTSAEVGAKIGEKVGLAKECATFVASGGIGQQPGATAPDDCTTAGGAYTASWSGSPTGVKCLGTSVDGKKSATITVSSTGGLSCAAAKA